MVRSIGKSGLERIVTVAPSKRMKDDLIPPTQEVFDDVSWKTVIYHDWKKPKVIVRPSVFIATI